MEWVILDNSYIILILIIAVLLNFFDKKNKASKGILTIASALIYVFALAFLCLAGAGYHELIVLMLIFLLFNFDFITGRREKE